MRRPGTDRCANLFPICVASASPATASACVGALGVALVLSAAPGGASGSNRDVGNGGEVVVCARDGREVVELFDHFEGRVFHGLEPELGTGPGVGERIEAALSRLDALEPERASRYRAWSKAFFESDSTAISDEADFPPLGDARPRVLPGHPGCRVVQVAIQHPPRFPGDKRYKYLRRWWDALDDDGRAGLVLHEVIYRDAIAMGALTSMGSRDLNMILSSGAIARFSPTEYLEFVREAGFRSAHVGGRLVDLGTREARKEVDLWESGALRRGFLDGVHSFRVRGGGAIEAVCEVELDEDGFPSSVPLAPGASFTLVARGAARHVVRGAASVGDAPACPPNAVVFDREGRVIEADVNPPWSFSTGTYSVTFRGPTTFQTDGLPSAARATDDGSSWARVNGRPCRVAGPVAFEGTRLAFVGDMGPCLAGRGEKPVEVVSATFLWGDGEVRSSFLSDAAQVVRVGRIDVPVPDAARFPRALRGIEFHEDGSVRSLTLPCDRRFPSSGGGTRLIAGGHRAFFDRGGRLEASAAFAEGSALEIACEPEK